MKNIKIVKNAEKPETTEILAEAVIRISENLERLQRSGLNQRAIEALVFDYTKVPKRDIKLILQSLAKMRGWYCR
jgi:ribosome biogenesis GTPase A